jgi:putative membrane protein
MMVGAYGVLMVLHILAVISWMAGLLYTPRLFVYHSQVAGDSEAGQLFQVMERKLLHAITVPACIAAWIFGGAMALQIGLEGQGWLHAKIGLVVMMTAYTVWMEKLRRDFAAGRNCHTQKFYRMINELPAILMIFIVALVVLKPF